MAKVLVTDDDSQILHLVSQVLELAGHDVDLTNDARDVHALALVARPDVIVLDVMMPMSGFEVLGALRRDPATAEIPILFLSGLADGEDRVRGLREGADDYLVKPFEPAELVLRVEKLASRRFPGAQKTPFADTGFGLDLHADPDASDESRKRFGRYQALDILGQGSMGTVYRARDPRLQREVALKTIRLDSSSSESRRLELLELLRREAVTLASLAHPNVVAVYDMGETPDTAYVAMELVDGVSLREYLRQRGALEPARLIPLGADIARGLASIHARQIVHRDVKPGNVLLGVAGEVKLSDFGLSQAVSAIFDGSSEVSGTPGYVPPEVLSEGTYTEPGDLFGLGATLYEGLAGVHPLAGETLRDTLVNTMEGRVCPLAERRADVPAALEELVMQLVAIDPGARPAADEVTRRLDQMVLDGQLRWDPSDLPGRRTEPLSSTSRSTSPSAERAS